MAPPTLARPVRTSLPEASRRRLLAALAGGLLSWLAAALAPERLKHPHGGRFAVRIQQANL
jgi:hypothetical protein